MKRIRILAVCGALALSGCGGTGGDGAVVAQIVIRILGCASSFAVNTPLGLLTNNVWNGDAAGSFAWSQCMRERDVSGTVQYGWTWLWPELGTVVLSQPEIIVGTSPWSGAPGNDGRFPRGIGDTNSLVVSYEVEIDASGSQSLVTRMWLINTPVVADPPDPNAVAVEFTIWTDSTADRNPPGVKRAEVTIEGVDWEIWIAEDWGNDTTSIRWTYVAYRARTPAHSISYDAGKILGDAITRGLIDPGLFIASVGLGNEVVSGIGTTWLKNFSVEVR